MFKKLLSAGISAALAFSVFIMPLHAEAAVTSGITFADTSTHWSLQAVEQASALGLLSGYPDGTFLPERMMTRLEAVSVIIRAMGLEESAKTANAASSGITLPQGMKWGQGFLVLAVEKGLLSKDYVSALKYNDAITRAEVATLVAAALGLKGDVTKLTYSDTASIVEMYKPYVAAVTQNNIMGGLGNNTFGPNQGMKRGQMAALISTLAKNNWFKNDITRLNTGIVTSFDANSGLIAIIHTDGTSTSGVLAAKTAIFNGTKLATVSDIQNGATVMTAPVGNTIKYLEIIDSSTTVPPTTPTDQNQTNTNPGPGTTTMPNNTTTPTPTTPVVTDNTTTYSTTADTILKGTVVGVEDARDRFKLQTDAGILYWIEVSDDCNFYDDVDDVVNKLSKLQQNWQVEVFMSKAEATEVTVIRK